MRLKRILFWMGFIAENPCVEQPKKRRRISKSEDGRYGIEWWSGEDWRPPVSSYETLEEAQKSLKTLERWQDEEWENKRREWKPV